MNSTNSTNSEMVFKGMRRFRYWQPEALFEDARRSPYYWWWNYLRLSKDYWWICQLKGNVKDLSLRRMYSDFGRVYEMTFEQWWKQRGVNLFSEQVAPPDVRELDPMDLRLSKDMERHLLLEIPVYMTERTIVAKVRQLLRHHAKREVKRVSTARRPLAKFIGIRQDVIQAAHQVWRVHYESRDDRKVTEVGKTQGTKSLYQIGKEMRLVRDCMPAHTDSKEKAAMKVNGMKVAVSRSLRRANNLTANAALGIFPSVKSPTTPIVWHGIQLKRLNEAVEAKVWRPLFDEDDTLIIQ